MKRLLLLMLVAPVVLAQDSLEVITLRHRTAEQVIPVLRPMLAPGAALSGQYYQLIVRTTPDNLAQLRDLISTLDQPARRLSISVRFDSANVSARAGARTDVRVTNRGSSANVRLQDERGTQSERVDQRLQVLEGGQAFISSGESRVYNQADTGFAVVPRVSGDVVSLDILAQQEGFVRGGAVQGQRVSSTVSGRLGEWIELGGSSGASARADGGPLSSRERTASVERAVWVKVEELR
jgi:hypothetical protein